MQIRLRRAGDVHVLALCGRVTIEDVDELDAYLRDLVSTRGVRRAALDLSEVTHIVSATVGSLIGFRERLVEAGGAACLVAPNRAIERISRMMDLGRFFETHADAETAIRALAGGHPQPA
ncbi:MAG: STAS domain-containing protein [Planctomycetales bacterium]|nr:STAS domain-containing protein [Planctomycetales bacterium]